MDESIGGPIDQHPVAAPDRLAPVPDALVATRERLHALAAERISPARQAVTGKIGLRALPGGFGTPPFGEHAERIHVTGTELVRERSGSETGREPIAGADPAACAFLAEWFAFGAAALLTLRTEEGEGADPSLIQLWPEHFDIAVVLGDEAAGARANYGFSPGDEGHPEPYAYVSTFAPQQGPLWNATGYSGAELGYAELRAAADPAATVLAWMRERFAALA